MSTWALIIIGIAVVIALFVMHRVALWLEREGWIRYIRNPPSTGNGAGAAVGELQRIFEPQTQHVYELKEENRPRREAEGGGEPPDEPV